MPVTTEVRPVLPPDSTPAADSTNVVITVQPNIAPMAVKQESTKKGLSIPGKLPSSSSIFSLPPSPITVPRVEKKSPKNVANNKVMNIGFKISEKLKVNSKLPTEEKSGSEKAIEVFVTPKGIPNTVTTITEMRIPPFTFLCSRETISNNPIIDNITLGAWKLP